MKDNSKKIGAILGPTMIAMLAAEFPLVQPTLYDSQIPPVVYLSGTLMFIAGLSIVRAHNHWKQYWTVLITISGWSFLTLGTSRMFFSTSYIQASENTTTATFIVVEGILLIIGLVITFKSYQNRKVQMLEIPSAPHQ
ncbi:MAG: hypothetical protein F6K19_49640 [Cyanothece sp. SIO1E1]|nr:hypothetical protein [Cyanothece sp. SIO1E1]